MTAMAGQGLFPELEPFETGDLPVDDLHTIYWEQSGHPDGVPVVFLHGGPGGATSPIHRRYYDPAHHRIVLFDQRGCGRSRPHAEIRNNTTGHLIGDMEALRARLGIERWLVTGGSWGSALTLAYAEAHPEHCLGLIVNGVWLCRPFEFEWFLYGMRTIFPENWRAFAEFLPPEERSDLLAGYHRRLIDPDPAVHLPAARAWAAYEMSCVTLLPNPGLVAEFAKDEKALPLARLEAHYMANAIFLPENALLAGLERIRHLPAAIVQARYDICTSTVGADELARAWPEAEYTIVPDAGHSRLDPANQVALVAAAERIKQRL